MQKCGLPLTTSVCDERFPYKYQCPVFTHLIIHFSFTNQRSTVLTWPNLTRSPVNLPSSTDSEQINQPLFTRGIYLAQAELLRFRLSEPADSDAAIQCCVSSISEWEGRTLCCLRDVIMSRRLAHTSVALYLHTAECLAASFGSDALSDCVATARRRFFASRRLFWWNDVNVECTVSLKRITNVLKLSLESLRFYTVHRFQRLLWPPQEVMIRRPIFCVLPVSHATGRWWRHGHWSCARIPTTFFFDSRSWLK